MSEEDPKDKSLDPKNWDEFRSLAHRMVDDMLDQVKGVRDEPAWQEVPSSARKEIQRELPMAGLGDEEAYQLFKENIFPYTNGNRHPRFYGWVQGTGTPLASMAEMFASAMNPHCAGFEQASTYVELQVVDWLKQVMGFPSESSGVLVSGGTMANFVGLAAARDDRAGFDVWNEGLQHSKAPRLVFYGSSETHGWAQKAANLLGLGSSAFRPIPVDSDFRIQVSQLKKTIQEDRHQGLKPFCVIGTAGTVNTGSIDDFDALADVCQSEDLWFHIDGAYGAWARLSDSRKHLVNGIERADSLGFDLHKWGYLPFEVACVLVRDPLAHRRPFSIEGSYIPKVDRGCLKSGLPFAPLGIELTRNFKALKVWLSWVSQGVDRLKEQIEQNIAHAEYLKSVVEEDPQLELLSEVVLNVICLRFNPGGLDQERLNEINLEILHRLHESGLAVPSSTVLHGSFVIRLALTNHRTRRADLKLLADEVVRHGRDIV